MDYDSFNTDFMLLHGFHSKPTKRSEHPAADLFDGNIVITMQPCTDRSGNTKEQLYSVCPHNTQSFPCTHRLPHHQQILFYGMPPHSQRTAFTQTGGEPYISNKYTILANSTNHLAYMCMCPSCTGHLHKEADAVVRLLSSS